MTTMCTPTPDDIPGGFGQTCWRGIRVAHPSEWEPGLLSGAGEPTRCVFVDRRFQRLEVHWAVLPRRPDLTQMYDRIARGSKGLRPRPLTGAGEWTGLVRREGGGSVVHVGRYFPDRRCLVQAVVTWPGGRDREVERAILAGTAPQPASDVPLWQALGLGARVPKEFELSQAGSKVGRITWEFRRSGRRWSGLTIERLAVPRYWLKVPLGEWLAGELPQGFRPRRESPVDCGGQGGTEIYSRRASLVTALLHAGISRLDRAWLCWREDRVYRVAWWQRAGGEIDWPAGLEICCCKGVRLC